MSVLELSRDWATDLKAANKAPRTIQTYLACVRRYTEACGDDLDSLTKATLRRWFADMGETHKASHCRIHYNSMKLFTRWLIEQDEMTFDPMEKIPRPVAEAIPVEPYTPEEIKALLDTCKTWNFTDRRDEAIIRMLICTGMRLSEIAGIKLEYLNRETKVVAVLGKGRKWRVVPYDDTTAVALRKYLRIRHKRLHGVSDALWLGERGDLGTEGVDQMLRRRARTAGLTGVRAHRFRHSMAISWMSKGGSEMGLMKIAGWSNGAMLQRYTAAKAVDLALEEFRRMHS